MVTLEQEGLLIERILVGDQEAFRQLIEQYQKLVNHIVFRFMPQTADREDACQEVFLKVHRNLQTFERKSRLSTWIGRIAYNYCLNIREKKSEKLFCDLGENDDVTADDFASQWASPEELAESSDSSFRLREEIGQLPVNYRTILSLYHLEEMNYAEIGLIMNLPEGTVKSHLFRGRRILKDRLLVKYSREDLW